MVIVGILTCSRFLEEGKGERRGGCGSGSPAVHMSGRRRGLSVFGSVLCYY